MKVGRIIFLVGFLLTTCIGEAEERRSIPVYPGAKGFGSTTAAGSGRHQRRARTQIIRVTNRSERGVGSLRHCIEMKGPRTCLFEVGGRFPLTEPLHIREPYLTIAGQTAPLPGVVLTGAGITIATHDILLQHLEIRVGDRRKGPKASERDGITIEGRSARKIVVDHLSVSWATDENVTITPSRARDITLSNCIISEGLHNSIHPKGAHSKGLLIGDRAQRITVHHSLFAHNHDRNPYLQRGAAVELLNNVVYNWGGESGSNVLNVSDYTESSDGVLLTLIGNTYKRGPDGPAHPIVYGEPVASTTRIFARDNVAPKEGSYGEGEWRVVDVPEVPHRVDAPPIDSLASWNDANSAFEEVLLTAGSRPRERNIIDARIVSEVREGRGTIKDCVSGCSRSAGGWPSIRNTRRRLRLPSHPFRDRDKDGYTELEEWLHKKAGEVQ